MPTDIVQPTTVVSIRSGEPYDILVDRSTPFGNPYSHWASECTTAIYKALSRFDAVRKHAEWIKAPEQAQLLSRVKKELQGKVLGCHCTERDIQRGMCHAVTLAKIADRRDR